MRTAERCTDPGARGAAPAPFALLLTYDKSPCMFLSSPDRSHFRPAGHAIWNTGRRPPGDARAPDPPDALARADARLGDHPAHQAALRGRVSGRTGIAVPGTAAAGEEGVDLE